MKNIKILSCLCIFVVILLLATGCKKDICEKNGHDFSGATCEKASTCKICNKINGTSLGHNYEKVETINPTCLSNGYIIYECTRCNYKKMDTIESTGHDLTEIELLPTCTEEGKHTIKCINCDYKKEHKIKKLGHVEVVDKGYPATCSKKGLTDGIHCDVCNEVLVPQEEILELEHTFDDTRDDDCNVCGFTRDSDYIKVKEKMNLFLGIKIDELISLTKNYESIIICPDSLFYIFTVEDKYNVVVEYPAYAEDAAARIEVYYKKEPILEDFESILKGMTVYEVVEIIGVPSDYSTTSSGMKHYVSYDVDENTKFTVIFVDKLNELNLVNDTIFYKKN